MGRFDLLALSAFLSSVISSFLTQNKGAGVPAPPLDPSLGSIFLNSFQFRRTLQLLIT